MLRYTTPPVARSTRRELGDGPPESRGTAPGWVARLQVSGGQQGLLMAIFHEALQPRVGRDAAPLLLCPTCPVGDLSHPLVRLLVRHRTCPLTRRNRGCRTLWRGPFNDGLADMRSVEFAPDMFFLSVVHDNRALSSISLLPSEQRQAPHPCALRQRGAGLDVAGPRFPAANPTPQPGDEAANEHGSAIERGKLGDAVDTLATARPMSAIDRQPIPLEFLERAGEDGVSRGSLGRVLAHPPTEAREQNKNKT